MDIIGASRVVDDIGDLSESTALLERAAGSGLRIQEFKIASMGIPWQSALPEGTFRCACAPIEAMRRARSLLASGRTDVVAISGQDYLRAALKARGSERKGFARIYGQDGPTILEAYNQLAHAFIERYRISADGFRQLSAALFDNYLRTWRAKSSAPRLPDPKWYGAITDLFRGVDCANPWIDFGGCLILAEDRAAHALGLRQESRIRVRGLSVEQRGEDGVESIPQVIGYDHITRSFETACRESGVDFKKTFLEGQALLEVYTCYPVVPIAFLLKTQMVESPSAIPSFLDRYAITITGGLNLARAPGNNSTLSALIETVETLRTGEGPAMAGVHSIGALGYLQAFCILSR
ncbi:MAG TPA: hypothetical protein VKN99_07165 [Polyangia bacterium]|nr:hypothetical protein [Polyangia bacterium]